MEEYLYRVNVAADPKAVAAHRAMPVLKQEYDPDLGARDGVAVTADTLQKLIAQGRLLSCKRLGKLVGSEHFAPASKKP